MRICALLLFVCSYAESRVIPLRVEQGRAEIEIIGASTFRFARSWTTELPRTDRISHPQVTVQVEEPAGRVILRTSELVIEIDLPELRMRVQTKGAKTLLSETSTREGDVTAIDFLMAAEEKFAGLGADGPLNLRGQRMHSARPLLYSSNGYGRLVRAPTRPVFDLARGRIEFGAATGFEYVFYYGPSPKDILEEHMKIVGEGDPHPSKVLEILRPDALPRGAEPLPAQPISSWSALGGLVRTLNQWSMSGVRYPVFDLSMFRESPAEVRARTMELAALLPLISNGLLDRSARQQRERWKPYLITYLREAYDRGYPLIHPLIMQFSRDPEGWTGDDVFMLGDEILIAPVFAPGTKRTIDLPRGRWTDLRTNREYAGRQRIEIEAPTGAIPMLVKSGSLIPIAAGARTELHYFPPLGGEWFQWEPELADISQFHASPAGDFIRAEIETRVDRMYEWVIHHTGGATEVAEGTTRFEKVATQDQLKPGAWWQDEARKNLHIVIRAEKGSDRILNVRF